MLVKRSINRDIPLVMPLYLRQVSFNGLGCLQRQILLLGLDGG